jgi:hypothetical protein
MGPKYKALLSPGVKKGIMDSVVQFLQMGTWTVIGDIQRVYRGPDLHYNGWQRASNTTPDELFGTGEAPADTNVPAWARRFEEAVGAPQTVSRSPEESRGRLISHILDFFPEAEEKTLLKLV